jgi:gliding motility-associated-like protein
LFPAAGVYPVKLSIVTIHGGIADTTINVTVTEGSRPHSNFGANPSTVCLGQPITFSDSTSYFYTEKWYWDFGNGYRDTVLTNLDRQYTYTAPGTYIVRHTLMGTGFACLPDTVNRTVIVATTPSITSVTPSPTNNCSNIANGSFAVAGLLPNTPHVIKYTYNATVYTVNATSNASGIATVTGLAIGTYTNIMAIIGNCSSAPAGPITIGQPAGPAAPTASGPASVCVGNPINLTASTSLTGTISYNWTGPNGFTNTTQNPTIASATTAMTGTYSVTVTQNGCVSAAATVPVTVNALPVIGSSSVNTTQTCNTATGSILLNGLLANTTYTVKYTFNSNVVTTTATTNGTGTLTIPNLSAGTYSNVFVLLGTCQSTSVGPFVVTDPNPPAAPTATANTPLCEGTTLNLSATSGLSNITFEWTGPNGFTSTQQNPTITPVTLAATGTYNVVVVNQSNCKSAPFPVAVVVKPLPSVPTASVNTPICAGSTLNLTASNSTTGATYAWTGPNSFTSSVQNPSITNATIAATGSYTVTATLNGCSVTSTPISATVNVVPAITTSSKTNPTNCNTATGSITLNGLAANTAYTVSYTSASGVQTASITSNASGTVTIANLAAGTYSSVTVAANSCTSNTVGPFVLTDPAPPATPVATNNGPVCSGTTLNLSATSSTAGVTYAWTGPNGFTSTLQNPSISNVTMAANGLYSVTATLNNCVSTAGTTTPVVRLTPAVTTATPNNPTQCLSATGSIVLDGLTAAATYTVTYTKNTSPVTVSLTANASGTVTIANLAAGTYSNIVLTVNGCSSTAVGPFTLTDPAPPATPVASSNTPLCAGNTLNLTAFSNTPGVSYNWTGPNGFTSNQQNPTINNVALSAIGSYTVIATLNNCVSAPAPATVVVVYATPVIGSFSKTDPTNCNTNTGSIKLDGLLANSTYTINYTFNTTAQTTTATTNASGSLTINSLGAGTYNNITATIAQCPSLGVGPITLVDPAPPATPTITAVNELCENGTLNLLASTTTSGAVTYAWTGPNGFTSNLPNPSITSITTSGTGTYTVVATLNSCTSTNSKPITIRPYPVVAFTTPSFVCMPNGVVSLSNLTTISDNSTLTYSWDFGDGSLPATTFNATHVYASISSYPIKLTATAGICSASKTIPFSAFYDKPVADFKVDNNTICQGIPSKFTDLSTAPNSTLSSWYWDFGTGAPYTTTAAVNSSPTKLYAQPGNYIVRLVVKNAQGCVSDTTHKPVIVYLQPVVDAGPSFTVPEGTIIKFMPTVNDSSATTIFKWTPPLGLSSADSLRPTLTVKDKQVYWLTMTGDGGCNAKDSLTVVALKALNIPNAFSPNGDGKNDKWEITNLEDYYFAQVQIFNRNGQVVFSSFGYRQPWDGTYNGKPLPVGVYYYIIDFKNAFPQKSGYVTILR